MAKKILLALITIISVLALAQFASAYEEVFYIYDNQDLDARYNNYFYNSNQQSYVYVINQNQYNQGYRQGYDDAQDKYYGNSDEQDFNDERYASNTPFRYSYEVKNPVYNRDYSQPKLLKTTKTTISNTYATSGYRYYPGAVFPAGYFERLTK